MKQLMRVPVWVCGLLTAVTFPAAVETFSVTFDGGNYSPGTNLEKTAHSEGVRWIGGGADFQILAGAGVEGSDAVVTAEKPEGLASCTIDPGAELAGFEGNSSVVEASFRFRFLDEPGEVPEGVVVVQLGFNKGVTNLGAARFGIRADGTLTRSDGASSSILVRNFRVSDTTSWTKLSVVLNYQTKDYTFFINDVQQGGVHKFQGEGDFTDSAVIRLQNVGSAEHRQVAFDDFTLVVRTP